MNDTKNIDPYGLRRRATATVARLTEESWGVQYSEEGIVLRRGGAWVTITETTARRSPRTPWRACTSTASTTPRSTRPPRRRHPARWMVSH